MNPHVEAVLNILTDEQVYSIRDNDKAYVVFWVSVCNAFTLVDLEFVDDMPTIPQDSPYSFYLDSSDAVYCLDQRKV